jgi:hypothetical protein
LVDLNAEGGFEQVPYPKGVPLQAFASVVKFSSGAVVSQRITLKL